MRVALFGGTGYVGSYLVDRLLQTGMRPALPVRPGSERRVRHRLLCDIVNGQLGDDDAVARVLHGADAAIFNVGILREFPERSVTFEALHFEAARHVMQAAEEAGIRRFLLMSANGVRAGGTPYQDSKFRAEQFLAGTSMDWTIFRPSVIFGNPRGRNEFASQLARDIIASPLPAPLFFDGLLPWEAGGFALSPVHVRDVAQAFVSALDNETTFGEILPLGGPATISWRTILRTIAEAAGRQKRMLPVPALGVSALATALERFESFPITRDQMRMLMEGNTCSDRTFALLGIEPTPFGTQQLRYLAKPREARKWHRNAA